MLKTFSPFPTATCMVSYSFHTPLEFYKHKFFQPLCLPKIQILPPGDLFLRLSRASDGTLSPGGRVLDTPSLPPSLFTGSHKSSDPFPFGGNFSWYVLCPYNRRESRPKEPYPIFNHSLLTEVFLLFRDCSLHAGFLL